MRVPKGQVIMPGQSQGTSLVAWPLLGLILTPVLFEMVLFTGLGLLPSPSRRLPKRGAGIIITMKEPRSSDQKRLLTALDVTVSSVPARSNASLPVMEGNTTPAFGKRKGAGRGEPSQMDRGLSQGCCVCTQKRKFSRANHRGSREQPFQTSLPSLFKRAPARMMGKGCGG